jgi:hypothetical protein
MKAAVIATRASEIVIGIVPRVRWEKAWSGPIWCLANRKQPRQLAGPPPVLPEPGASQNSAWSASLIARGALLRRTEERFAERIGEDVVEEEIQDGQDADMLAAGLVDRKLRHDANFEI